jgi:hypothetical protein
MTNRVWVYKWQYNGAAPMKEIIQWCSDNLKSDSYSYLGWETIWFSNPEDYSYFLLRWV